MLSDQSMLDAVRTMLTVTMAVVLPILGAGLVIGLVISIFQAVTSIQDQTLSFAPKLVAMIAVLILLLPWTVAKVVDFAQAMFTMG